jgi:hypothetical protein
MRRRAPASLPSCSACVLCDLLSARRDWLVESAAVAARPALLHHACVPPSDHIHSILRPVVDALLVACTAHPARGGAAPEQAVVFLRASGYDVARAVGCRGGERDSVGIATDALEGILLSVLATAVARGTCLATCERHMREMLEAVRRGAEESSSDRPAARQRDLDMDPADQLQSELPERRHQV